MDWHSEMAVVWLPKDSDAYPEQFSKRAEPGTSNFFYYALDAFHAIFEREPEHPGEEPWGYLLSEQRIMKPAEISALRDEWQAAFEAELSEERARPFQQSLRLQA
jgi:hypothetical protein